MFIALFLTPTHRLLLFVVLLDEVLDRLVRYTSFLITTFNLDPVTLLLSFLESNRVLDVNSFSIRGQLIIEVINADVNHLTIINLIFCCIKFVRPKQHLLLAISAANVETEHALPLTQLR